MKDSKIIEKIEKGQVQLVFRKLYSHFNPIKKYVINHGGDKDDALDLFQDALIVFYKKVKAREYKAEAKISTYLFSICKYQWIKELKKKNKNVSFESDQHDGFVEEFDNREERFRQMQAIILGIGKKCRDLLYSFYYHSLSMATIAKKYGYSSINSAKTQKYKCLERARSKAILIK